MRIILGTALFAFLGPIATIMGFNYYIDRFQYYRPWSGPTPIFSRNERWQNAGLARQYRYDTVIIGTSRSQNFTARMFEPAGWRVMKLTAAGSTSHIHAKTLQLAIGTGQVRRAIVELSYNVYLAPTNYLRTDLTFPEFLYEPTIETPFTYLLSFDLFKESRKIVNGKLRAIKLEEIGIWQPRVADQFGKNLYLAKVQLNCAPFASLRPDWRGNFPAMDAAIETNLAAHLRAHPEVDFLGYLPPFPITWFGSAGLNGRKQHLGFRHRVYELAARFDNFHLFDFALMNGVVDDPHRYKDFGHYDQATNQAMAEAFMAGAGEVSATTATAANARLIEAAQKFDWARWANCRASSRDAALASGRPQS